MAFFTFRNSRIDVDIPVHIFLQEKESGILSIDYSAASIINLSRHGACVKVEKMILNGKHLFFTTQQQSVNFLCLQGNFEDADLPDISATSIWMNGFSSQGKQFFKIGMKFTKGQEDFFSKCKRRSTESIK